MNLHEIARQAFYGSLPATNDLAMKMLPVGTSHVSIADIHSALMRAPAEEIQECLTVDGGTR